MIKWSLLSTPLSAITPWDSHSSSRMHTRLLWCTFTSPDHLTSTDLCPSSDPHKPPQNHPHLLRPTLTSLRFSPNHSYSTLPRPSLSNISTMLHRSVCCSSTLTLPVKCEILCAYVMVRPHPPPHTLSSALWQWFWPLTSGLTHKMCLAQEHALLTCPSSGTLSLPALSATRSPEFLSHSAWATVLWASKRPLDMAYGSSEGSLEWHIYIWGPCHNTKSYIPRDPVLTRSSS